MSRSTSTPIVGHPGEGVPLSPKEQLKAKIDLLRQDPSKVYKTDVLVVGSGPIGAVFARKLVVDGNKKVLMIDMGEQASKRIGDHRKNSVAVQKDISLFTKLIRDSIIRGELSPLSVPVAEATTQLPPESSWTPELNSDTVPPKNQFILNGQNPEQRPEYNLAASAATRTVGGMAAHWTCCTPRQYPDAFAGGEDIGHRERSDLFTDDEWGDLYAEAETLFQTNVTTFDDSVRQRLVKKILQEAFAAENADRAVQSMPLACKPGKNKKHIDWSCTASILGDELSNPDHKDKPAYSDLLTVLPQTQLDVMLIEDDGTDKGGAVTGAVIVDLETSDEYLVDAERYVICGGTVLTSGIVAQSLFKSELETEDEFGHIGASYLPTLGRYLTEQTMTFCQIVLKKEYVQMVSDNPEDLDEGDDHTISDAVHQHQQDHPDDPLPFPFDDLDPNVYTPFSEKYPWHTQIHRDAFGYGEVPADVDQRLIVDLRFFGYVDPNMYNKITFSATRRDGFGMPQPTFWFSLGKKDIDRSHRMMRDMVDVATSLGGFLPGAEPRHLAPGLALHVCGIYRAGKEVQDQNAKFDLAKTKEDSAVSKEGRVWGVSNLYLGGCGVIPTGNASNPTLTAACHAIAGANQIIKELGN
ncbi:hypothetical protein N8I77_007095 [Diaporthe amygdali]|uniref:Glucose-methanol-choline oxidoreductase C-terminal domain-containing protein n=1 Tax=Phomopsis amygdali TaxID=1214568 RepID=A0AAD9SCC0_PHOAM|nr:hypothetical protein N8I77_007095 [Diaporthe amygdali]